jgi:hypothetical protein
MSFDAGAGNRRSWSRSARLTVPRVVCTEEPIEDSILAATESGTLVSHHRVDPGVAGLTPVGALESPAATWRTARETDEEPSAI